MANERLRAALLQRGSTLAGLAEALDVDPKTVERWVSGRIPYRRHRYAIAAELGAEESYLWPDALSSAQVAHASESEILTVHPHRWTVPREVWGRLFASAEQHIDVLVYSGMFLADDPGILRLLREKLDAGVRVRVALGDPDGPEVAQRGVDEGIDDAMAAKIRNAMVLYRPLREFDGFELRLHSTTLYNSIYRADDDMLINCHVFAVPAASSPVLHLRKVAGGDMITTYLESFEAVWSRSRPAT